MSHGILNLLNMDNGPIVAATLWPDGFIENLNFHTMSEARDYINQAIGQRGAVSWKLVYNGIICAPEHIEALILRETYGAKIS